MNDVLPKPFTKEGLLHMLEKHLAHLKKPIGHMDGGMVAPQPLASTRQVLKEEESPAKSPATASWNSPNAVPGVSPVGTGMSEEYLQAVHANPAAYAVQGVPGMPAVPGNVPYAPNPQVPMPGHAAQQAGHRRQISDISGGDGMNNPAKRQQMYAPAPLPPQPMNPMHRPR